MNKCQEALNKLENLSDKDLCKEYYLEWLQKLVDKETTMTKEEVIKKFEELGYLVEEDSLFINLTKYEKRITIFKKNKCYECFDNDEWDKYSLDITLQEHQLLTELFKALGWFDDNKNR